MATATTLEELQKKRNELMQAQRDLDTQIKEFANKKYRDALFYLEKNDIDFLDLQNYYNTNNAKTIYRIEYEDGANNVVFERKQGQIGVISIEQKMKLRALGRNALMKAALPGYEMAGAKIVESIFKDRKPRS